LIAARASSLVGNADLVETTLSALLSEAACRRWSTVDRIVFVGRDRHHVTTSAICRVDSPDEALAAALSPRLLATPGWPLDDKDTTCEDGPGIDPIEEACLIVIAPEATKDGDLARIIDEAKDYPAIGFLVAAPVTGARFFLGAGREPTSSTVYTAFDFPAAQGEDATALSSGPPRRQSARDQTPPVEVAILGPIDIRGIEGSLAHRPKLTELVVFLAMHPEGATTRTWATALWPDRRVPPQTIANRLSEARRALGFAPDGRPRLRRVGERHVIADITTDWQCFMRLAHNDSSPDDWERALELIRGRPFDDLKGGQWTTLDGFASEIEQRVADCALRRSEAALEIGDANGASWAAHRGLRANPWDERLHRMLMRAADAAGNRAGVEASLRQLACILEIEGDPLAGVHPETAALYERLLGRKNTASLILTNASLPA
jgi:DNA-binding SARP family transcriptional activator